MDGDNITTIKCDCGATIRLSNSCSNGRVGLCSYEHGDTGMRLYIVGANGQGISQTVLKTEEDKRWGSWLSKGGDNPSLFQ